MENIIHTLKHEYTLDLTEKDIAVLKNLIAHAKESIVNDYIGEIILKTEIITFLVTIPVLNNRIPFAKIICNRKVDSPDINYILAQERQWIFIETSDTLDYFIKSNTPQIPIYLGTSLWTCACETDFIKTSFHIQCSHCKVTKQFHKQKYQPLPDLFLSKEEQNENNKEQ